MAAPHTPGSTATRTAGGQAGASASAQGGEDPWYTGGGALEDIAGISSAVSSGNWVQGGLSTASLIADTASAFIDPLGTALSWGAAIIMDHCQPLRGWLQKLAGNKDDVLQKANSWRSVACALEENATRLKTNVTSFTQYSRGQAAESFAQRAGGISVLIAGASKGAHALAEGMKVLSSVVEIVYSMVRDAIAQIVGTFISAVVQAFLSAGLALAKLIPEIVMHVKNWATKLAKSVKDLISTAGKLKDLFTHGREAVSSIMSKIKEGIAGLKSGEPHLPHTPETPREHYSSPVEVDPSSVRSREDLVQDVEPYPGQLDKIKEYPAEGQISGVTGADLVHNPDKVCGYEPDGTPRNYEGWKQATNGEWPPNDGYAGERSFSTIDEYTAAHGTVVDRVGGPGGGYMGAVENGHVSTFEERALAPSSVHEPYYQYEFTGEMPEGWKIEHGTAAPWESEVGGARQVRVLDAQGNAMTVQKLLDKGVLRSVEVPVGLH